MSSTGWLQDMRRQIGSGVLVERYGRVAQVTGLIIESEGPQVRLHDLCEIIPEGDSGTILAEVVGFREHRVLLMPLQEMQGIHAGCAVRHHQGGNTIPVGDQLLGRVLNGLGKPIDDRGPLFVREMVPARQRPPNPLLRKRIQQPFSTRIKAIDTFVPVGKGQRLGIFSGSGVGKSTLLGMLARGSEAGINVIALIGERGRELREFIEKDLGEEGLARSVLIVSTSDEAAPVRLRAANFATAVAESFRDQGKDVLFMMDSVTRFAMAQREVGLAIGEPPTSRGYTPSVYSVLPRLLERTGMGEIGSITAFYTVLVEGDDFNEPVVDTVRGILDGHVVLSRQLATANQYPAVDVLSSISRLALDVCTPEEGKIVSQARDILAMYRKNEDLINIGAYQEGANRKIDRAIALYDKILAFLRQGSGEHVDRTDAFRQLSQLVS